MPQRSYQRACGLARALELVGDRWTLLIIRQLLAGPKRYSDLQSALHGLSTNLLSDRLHRLEADGLIDKRELPPPAASTVYDVTEFGASVEPAILELMRWGSVLLADPDRLGEPADPDWALFPLRWLAGKAPLLGTQRVAVCAGGAPELRVVVTGHTALPGWPPDTPSEEPADLEIHAESGGVLGAVLGGHLDLGVAIGSSKVRFVGNPDWFTHALQVAYSTDDPRTGFSIPSGEDTSSERSGAPGNAAS